jgi:hypothetical protein
MDRMRWLLALLLIVLLAACGGGSGDDDSHEVTPTVMESSATATLEPSPTVAASPTSPASPVAIASQQPGGGIQPAVTSPSDEPTPTKRPATVVSEPRPIAKTPTPRQSFPQATETPTEEDDGVTVLIDESFDDPASTLFFTGESDYGVVAAIENGLYSLTVPEGVWQNIVVEDTGDLGNAAILVDTAMQGDGATGVVARSVTNDDGTWTFYLCWLATDGRAGCHISLASTWTQLFAVDAGTIEILDINELFLSVVGDEINFTVNDVPIGTISDTSSPAGIWGVYAESFTGTSVAVYDQVTIATIDQ